MSRAKVDVKVADEGTLWQFFTLSPAAKVWVNEHIKMENFMRQGENVFVAEHRYGPELVLGMQEDGLFVAPF